MIVCQHQGHYAVFFFLAKYRGISKTRFFRWKRKVFKESKPCREKRYKAQATEASKSLQRVQTVS